MNIQIFGSYSQQGLYRAIDVFNFPETFPTLTRILSYKYLFQYHERDRRIAPNRQKIINTIKEIVKKNRDNPSYLMELVDILLEYSKKDGDELLNYLRTTQQRATRVEPVKTNGPKGTIYADSQSVHNSSITQTIKTAAKNLCDKYYSPYMGDTEKNKVKEDIRKRLLSHALFCAKEEVLDTVLTRIYSDITKFEGYRAGAVLFSIWNWIGTQGNDELYNRMAEEVFEMHKYCATRILSGLINIIQGFTDDDKFLIKMNLEEQCKSVVYAYLDKKLKECKDERVIDGMYEKDQVFLDFVIEVIDVKREEWETEYGEDFTKYLSANVNKYVQVNIF
jgi:hypothetical protein